MLSAAVPSRIWAFEDMNIDVGSNAHLDSNKIPVSGRARNLLFGPYEALMPGVWEVRFTLSVDKWAYIYGFRAEFGAGEDYSQIAVKFDLPGRYAISLTHHITHSEPCEFRFVVTEGALQGAIEFESLELFQR